MVFKMILRFLRNTTDSSGNMSINEKWLDISGIAWDEHSQSWVIGDPDITMTTMTPYGFSQTRTLNPSILSKRNGLHILLNNNQIRLYGSGKYVRTTMHRLTGDGDWDLLYDFGSSLNTEVVDMIVSEEIDLL